MARFERSSAKVGLFHSFAVSVQDTTMPVRPWCVIMLVIALEACVQGFGVVGFRPQRLRLGSTSRARCAPRPPRSSITSLRMKSATPELEVEFKVVSMNILAPCYRKVEEVGTSDGEATKAYFEKDRPTSYMERNEKIIDQLLESKADVICLQEFWSSNDELQSLYVSRLCDDEDYTMKILPRTSHWRKRDDGLAVFVKEERVFIQDYRDILFHDCGDRVAQMLLLAMRPETDDWNFEEDEDGEDEEWDEEDSDEMPLQQFLVVNTHLLFPHNEYSSKIRLREATKILGFVESYRQRELCRSVCSRSSVRLPIIVTGDFNGSPNGQVYDSFTSQNYQSAFSQRQEFSSLVTHKSHRGEAINVDHVFYLNPSDQTEEMLEVVPVPDWTNLVFRELKEKIIATYGMGNFYEAFRSFDMEDNEYITKEQFSIAVRKLGFGSEGQPALTSDEISVLLESADKNGDGKIDFKEFCERFWKADNNLMVADPDDVENKGLATSVFLVDSGVEGIEEGGAGAAAKWGASMPAPDSVPVAVSATASATPSTTATTTEEDVNNKQRPEIIYFDGDDAPGTTREFGVDLDAAQARIQSLPESRPLGDLTVKDLDVLPAALREGHWPADFHLSDHGMVEVTFAGTCLPAEREEQGN